MRGSISTATHFLTFSRIRTVRLPVPGPTSSTTSVGLRLALSTMLCATAGFWVAGPTDRVFQRLNDHAKKTSPSPTWRMCWPKDLSNKGLVDCDDDEADEEPAAGAWVVENLAEVARGMDVEQRVAQCQ